MTYILLGVCIRGRISLSLSTRLILIFLILPDDISDSLALRNAAITPIGAGLFLVEMKSAIFW